MKQTNDHIKNTQTGVKYKKNITDSLIDCRLTAVSEQRGYTMLSKGLTHYKLKLMWTNKQHKKIHNKMQ